MERQISKSTKSDSGSSKRPNWRLKKTLARGVSFRPIENEDLKYFWAAYKKGCLKSMGGVFTDAGMNGEEFKVAFETEILTNYHGAWTLFGPVKNKGVIPVGAVLGFYSHPDPRLSPFMIVGDMLWFPWTGARNRIEGAVNFFNRIRTEIRMVEYASETDKKFFETIAKHGIMRRVGQTYNVRYDEPTTIFETISRMKAQ